MTSPCSTRSTADIARRSPTARRSSTSTCATPRRRAASCDRASTACCTSPRSRSIAESVASPERYYHGNVVASLHLLDAMRAAGVQRIVFSSTCATYGEPERVPIAETTSRRRPSTPTAAPKLAVDRMLADEARAHGLGAVSLRYFNVGGASGHLGEDHEPETHLIPLVLRAAAAPPTTSRSSARTIRPRTEPRSATTSTSKTSPARTCWRSTAPSPAGTRSSTWAPGTGYSVREVIETARAVTGREIPVRERPPPPGRPAAAGRRHPRSATRSAGCPSARSRTWSATPGRGTRRTPAATSARISGSAAGRPASRRCTSPARSRSRSAGGTRSPSRCRRRSRAAARSRRDRRS